MAAAGVLIFCVSETRPKAVRTEVMEVVVVM
jgi:hypothetical protein